MTVYISNEFGGGHRPEPHQPQQVTWRATASGDTPVSAAHNLLQAAAREHSAFLDRMAGVATQYTQDGLKAQLSNFRNSEAGQVPDVVDQFAARLEAEAQTNFDNKIRGLASPGDTAQELRNQRTLNRVARQLDGASEGEKAAIAQKAIADNADDPAAVGVLVTELPSFGVSDSLIRAAATAARPELAEAATKVTKARQSSAILRNDARRVRESFTDGRKLAVPLVNPAAYDPDGSAA
jgi:hypothetical protein